MNGVPCRNRSTEPLRANTSNPIKNNRAYSNAGLSTPLALMGLLLLLLCHQGAWGQSGRANITGLVTDSSDAAVFPAQPLRRPKIQPASRPRRSPTATVCTTSSR